MNSCTVQAVDGGIIISLSDGKQRCEAGFNITAAAGLRRDIGAAILEAIEQKESQDIFFDLVSGKYSKTQLLKENEELGKKVFPD